MVAPGNYYDWRVQAQSFSAIGAFQPATLIATRDAEPSASSEPSPIPDFRGARPPRCSAASTPRRKEPAEQRRDPQLRRVAAALRRRPAILGRTLDLSSIPHRDRRHAAGLRIPGTGRHVVALELILPPRRAAISTACASSPVSRRPSRSNRRALNSDHAAHLAAQYPDLNAGETATINPVLDDLVGAIRPRFSCSSAPSSPCS